MIPATVAVPRRAARIRITRLEPATAVLILLVITAGVFLMYAGRHLTFMADEWLWIQHLRSGGIDSFLQPYNDHFVLVPIAVYRLLFAMVGISDYTAYRAVGVALALVCAVLLYVLVRRRLGAWLALVPTALLLFMGTAAEDVLWPLQIAFLGSVAGGLGALILLEDRRSDALAALLLVFSIASSGVGLAFLVASFVILLAQRDHLRRFWIVAVPMLVFVVWYVGWGESQPITVHAMLSAPKVVVSAAAELAAAMAGKRTLSSTSVESVWGPLIAIVGVTAFVISWRRVGGRSLTPLLLAAIAGLLTYWALIALQRSGFRNRDTSRYLYVGAVFVWLIVAEVRLGSGLSGVWLALAALLVAGVLIKNVEVMRTTERTLRALDDRVRASLTAVEVAAPIVEPTFRPYPGAAPEIVAGPYLAAARVLGSPAFTVGELSGMGLALRQRADAALVGAERLTAVPSAATSGFRVSKESTTPPVAEAQAFPGSSVLISTIGAGPVGVYLRRFAPRFSERFTVLAADSTSAISFPADRAPGLPWHVLAVPRGAGKLRVGRVR